MCCSALDNSWRQCWTKKEKKTKKKQFFVLLCHYRAPKNAELCLFLRELMAKFLKVKRGKKKKL